MASQTSGIKKETEGMSTKRGSNTVINTSLHRFILEHSAGIYNDSRHFSGAWMTDPGPSYARCSPIQFTKKDNGEIVSNSTFLVRVISMASYYAHCSVGIHTEVDRFFEQRKKKRVGFELSVHGHYVKFRQNCRLSTRENLDAEPLEWADGDMIKLYFDALNKKIQWWHNGIRQREIDVLDCMANTVGKGSQENVHTNSNDDTNIKWCFYVRGIQVQLEIEDNDLTDEEYEILRESYPSRLKRMKDEREAEGPCDPDDW